MSCFPRDNVTDLEIVKFDNVLEDSQSMLIIHRVITYVACITIISLNLLLQYIILKTQNDVCQLRPLLLVSTIVNTTYGFLRLLTCRYSVAAYFRYLCFSNAPYSSNRPVMAVFLFFEMIVMIIGWDLVPIQFLYRYCLLRYGRPPYGSQLLLFVGVCTTFTTLHVCSGMPLFVFRSFNNDFQANAVKILQHHGYNIPKEMIYGNAVGFGPKNFFSVLRPYLFISINFAVIVSTTYAVHQKLKEAAVSSGTRQFHVYVQKMLIILSVSLFITCVFTNIITSNIAILCYHYKWISLVNSCLTFLEPLVSPIVSLYFIIHYRNAFHSLTGRLFASSKIRLSHQAAIIPASIS
ncbi:hypothetical protein M3Y95_00830400 [Aphelenchoides besseyi]|nr:hypothetical protein M3Y95_00830400 [Aphelenchoides besseyi]